MRCTCRSPSPWQLSITSADVIHSFWAPALGGKRDAPPGHVTRIAFRADSVGRVLGQCAEFCGHSHANMGLRVVVDADSAFETWVKTEQSGPATPAPANPAERGKAVYSRSACLACHTIQGVSPGVIGPNLSTSAAVPRSPRACSRTIRAPRAVDRRRTRLEPGSLMPGCSHRSPTPTSRRSWPTSRA